MADKKKSLFERIVGSSKAKTDMNKGNLEAQVKATLKKLVYDDEIVDELTPTFLNFYGKEGFSEILELLESKEQQIEYISGGDWFKQESNPDNKSEDKEEDEDEGNDALNFVDKILSDKYSTEKK